MTKAQENLWNKTSADFKAVFGGRKFIMRSVGGSLKFVAVEELA